MELKGAKATIGRLIPSARRGPKEAVRASYLNRKLGKYNSKEIMLHRDTRTG